MVAKLTQKEINRRSTPEERAAVARYKAVQERLRENGGYMGETDALIASEAVGIIVERNKRLGLCK